MLGKTEVLFKINACGSVEVVGRVSAAVCAARLVSCISLSHAQFVIEV